MSIEKKECSFRKHFHQFLGSNWILYKTNPEFCNLSHLSREKQTRLFIQKRVHPIAPKYETQDQTVQIGKSGIRNLLKIQGAIKQMICWHWLTIRLFAKKGQWNAKSCFADCQDSVWILFMVVGFVPKNVITKLITWDCLMVKNDGNKMTFVEAAHYGMGSLKKNNNI